MKNGYRILAENLNRFSREEIDISRIIEEETAMNFPMSQEDLDELEYYINNIKKEFSNLRKFPQDVDSQNELKQQLRELNEFSVALEQRVDNWSFDMIDPDNITVRESNDEESGLYVYPHNQLDAQKINQLISDPDFPFRGEWDTTHGYFFFPEEEENLDILESDLEEWFYEKGISARYEGNY